MSKRVFLIVLDSFGCGEAPDADKFGDVGSNTLRSCTTSSKFKAENLSKLGIFNIDDVGCGEAFSSPLASYGKCRELSMGKDTTSGHWEICGVVSSTPMPTFPNGFPEHIIKEFEKRTGRGTLVNKPYSGTKVINDYGDEHVKTGKLIVYTSADSVFQIADHEDVVPLDELYKDCEIAREILTGDCAVGRVIARPFIGTGNGNYTRTTNRHDFSLVPPKTLLNVLSSNGYDVISIGKIRDIFAGSGVTESHPTKGNKNGMEVLDEMVKKDFNGLCFANLVDFDMLYGHRNDVDGYANAIAEFDEWLGHFLTKLDYDDTLIITADHGCDPATESTDHSREYIPLIWYTKGGPAENLGTRHFSDIGKTIENLFGLSSEIKGSSFLDKVTFEASPYAKFMKHSMRNDED